MERPADVDRNAPVVAHHTITVDAPLSTVWGLHTDVDAWATWNADITEARMDGPFEPGSSFAWSSYDFPVTSTIYAVEPQRRILWGGVASGITGIHEWLFDSGSDGVTITTTESFAGPPVDADVDGMQHMLDSSLIGWLAQIKRAAES